jgi:hypothetical protein
VLVMTMQDANVIEKLRDLLYSVDQRAGVLPPSYDHVKQQPM